MATTYELIDNYTVDSTQTTVSFVSIPSTYTDLILVVSIVGYSGGQDYYMRFNNDSSAAYYREITRATDSYGGNVATSAWATGTTHIQMGFNVVGVNAGQTAYIEYHISRYADTSIVKSCLFRAGSPNSGNRELSHGNAIWTSTSAINSIYIAGAGDFNTNNIAVGTKFALYGIKEA